MLADIVQTDYNALDNIATRFARQSEASREAHESLQRAIQPLQNGGWVGAGANAFYSEMDGEVFPVVQRLTDALQQAQSVTLQISLILQEAEAEAAACFQSRAGSIVSFQPGTNLNPLIGGAISLALSSPGVFLSNMLKGIAADTLLPQRYVLRALTPNLARRQATVAALMDMMAGSRGKGLPLIRFDLPHPGSAYTHINLLSKLTGFKDPHKPISPQLLNVTGQGARILQGVRRIALPLAITTDVFRLGTAFRTDGMQFGSETKQTVGSVAGGWGGAFAGAKFGAMGGAALGGALGTIVPGVGNVVGAGVGGFIGGLAGGIAGGIGGSELGNYIGGQL